MSTSQVQAEAIGHAFSEVSTSKALWDTCPLLDILLNPNRGTIFYEDFHYANKSCTTTNALASLTTYSSWSWNQVGTASGPQITHDDTSGGVIKLDAGNSTADDAAQIQKNGENWVVASGKHIWFEARVKMTNIANQVFVGLCNTDTSFFASGLMAGNDYVGFLKEGATTGVTTTGLWMQARNNGGTKDPTTAAVFSDTQFASATWYNLGFKIDDENAPGTYVLTPYLDGAAGTSAGIVSASLPSTAANLMTLSFHVASEGTTTPTLEADWVKVVQLR